MHLMDFEFFNNLIDDFTKWCRKQDFYVKDDWEFDPEMVPYELFLRFFCQDQNYLNQIFNDQSPMRQLLEFEGLFVDDQRMKKRPLSRNASSSTSVPQKKASQTGMAIRFSTRASLAALIMMSGFVSI